MKKKNRFKAFKIVPYSWLNQVDGVLAGSAFTAAVIFILMVLNKIYGG